MKLATTLLLTALAAPALSDCSLPDWDKPPAIPDGTMASVQDMVQARNDVSDYVKRTQSYLDCSSNIPFVHNVIVYELEKVAAEFNYERGRFLDRERSIAAN